MFGALSNFIVGWSGKLTNPYANNPGRKNTIEQDVKAYAENNGITARGAASAVIISTEHSGGTNRTESNHVTVEYKGQQGAHVTTKHVPVSR